jgi:hypothetical protein
MIGPGGLLFSGPHENAVPDTILLVGLPKKNS